MINTDENCFFRHKTQVHLAEDENEAIRIMHVNNNEESRGGKSFDDVSRAGLLPGGSIVPDNSGTRSARTYQWMLERTDGALSVPQT
jgi:hypothetical protein